MFPLQLCGGKLLVAVTRERRYGPSRLRVNDDDDDDAAIQEQAFKNSPGHIKTRQISSKLERRSGVCN